MAVEQYQQMLDELSKKHSAEKREGYTSQAALVGQAKTLRQRVFAKLVGHYEEPTIHFMHMWTLGLNDCGESKSESGPEFKIRPKHLSIRYLLAACKRSKACKEMLSQIPIVAGTKSADLELLPALQDLANIVAWEAAEAFTASYYPGIPGVEALSTDHIRDVVQALQREMDREGNRVGKKPCVFEDLPPDRRRALAERRRYWFGKYGITPAKWKTGRFSLWDISSDEVWPPEGYYNRYDNGPRIRPY